LAAKLNFLPTTLRLPPDIDAAIGEMAKARGLDRSTVLRSLLRRALNLPEPAPRDPLACDPKMEKNL
jgi:Ribbon-helix-helix protein, copG family